MAKKGKKGAKQAAKKGQQPQKAALNKTKKDKNVFKISNAKTKNIQQKAKAVPVKLKKINVREKQEKVDSKLKELHVEMVTKKPVAVSPAAKKSTPKRGAKKGANTKQVESDISKMKV